MRNKLSYLVVVKTEEELVDDTRRMNLEVKKAVLDSFRSVIAEGVEQGVFNKVDPSVAALGLIGMCSWCAWWFSPDGRLTDEEAAQELTSQALRSLLKEQTDDGKLSEISNVIISLKTSISSLEKKSQRNIDDAVSKRLRFSRKAM